jgi:hypothetical protein
VQLPDRPIHRYWYNRQSVCATEEWKATLPSDRWRSQVSESTCGVCYEHILTFVVHRACQFVLCVPCYRQWSLKAGSTCPLCRGALHTDLCFVHDKLDCFHVRPGEKWLICSDDARFWTGIPWVGFSALGESDTQILDHFRTRQEPAVIGLSSSLPKISLDLGDVTHVVTTDLGVETKNWLERIIRTGVTPVTWLSICSMPACV